MNLSNLSKTKATLTAERAINDLVQTTPKFGEILEAVGTNDKNNVIDALNDLFDDFKEVRYLLPQFKLIEDIIRPFLDDDAVIGLLYKVRNMINLNTDNFTSGILELDENGGTNVREINVKQDLIVLYERLTGLIKGPDLKTQHDSGFIEVRREYEDLHNKFINSLQSE